MGDKPSKPSGLPETVRTIGALSTVGLSFVLAIVIGVGVGYLLMTRFGLGRWVFFLFFIFGVVAGILNVYRTAARILK
ncbi:MAG TPA: AtpZ/AtpI family protein [Vicinamibacterales bacterium]